MTISKKAVQAAALAVVIIGSFAWTYDIAERKAIDPISYTQAGNRLRSRFPEYEKISDGKLGEMLFQKGYLTREQYGVLLERGLTDKEIYELVDRVPVYPERTQYLMYGAWLLVSFLLLGGFAYRSIRKKPEAHSPIHAEEIWSDKNNGEQ